MKAGGGGGKGAFATAARFRGDGDASPFDSDRFFLVGDEGSGDGGVDDLGDGGFALAAASSFRAHAGSVADGSTLAL